MHLPLVVHLNGEPFGQPNAGVDMTFDFGQLIAHAAKTRRLGAGTHRRLRHRLQPRPQLRLDLPRRAAHA